MPKAYQQLREITTRLEKHYKDIQDFEFTIQDNTLYMLQTRNGKRTGVAAVHIAVDLVDEGILTQKEAVLKVEPQSLDQLLHPIFDLKARAKVAIAAKGLPASPGAATGAIVFTADEAVDVGGQGQACGARAHGDGAGRHPRHERGPGHPHRHRRHDVARGRGRPPDGQAVRGRRGVAEHRRQEQDAQGRGPDPQGRRSDLDRRIDGRGHPSGAAHQPLGGPAGRERHPQGGQVAPVSQVREAAGLGGRDPAPGDPRQRGHPARRQGRVRLRGARHRPVPHRAHVLRGGPSCPTS